MNTPTDHNEPVDREKLLALAHVTSAVIVATREAIFNKRGLVLLGAWPDDKELPDDDTIKVGDAFIWRGCVHALDVNREWEDTGSLRGKPSTIIDLTVPMEDRKILPYRVIGSWPNHDDLPSAKDYPKDDALVYRHRVFVNNGEGDWVDTAPVSVLYETREVPLNEEELQEVPPVQYVVPPENKLVEDWAQEKQTDVGAMARELLERKAEVKRLKRKHFINRLVLWFVILGGIGVLGYFAYGLGLANYETGRYSDERQCKVVTDNLTITGKRTYSYPYKSFFGFRLIDESKVSEQTVINVAGDKMSIIGLTGKRWWGYRIGVGERGVQILKPADTYTISTDKGLAVVTYKGFCQAVGKQSEEPDPKAVDQAIID